MGRSLPYERARSPLAKQRLRDILLTDRDRDRDAKTTNAGKAADAPSELAQRRLHGTCDEPIRTRSMARLLASQGQPARALAIYEALVAIDGADPTLRAELEATRRLVDQTPA